MHVGMNPHKSKSFVSLTSKQGIFMVGCIPDYSEYYQASFKGLPHADVLAKTTFNAHGKITVVNNGTCAAVQTFFERYFLSTSIPCVMITIRPEIWPKIGMLLAISRGFILRRIRLPLRC